MGAFARWCLRHRKVVVLGWIAALVGLIAIASGVGASYTQDFRLPATESTKALDLLEQTFPNQAGETDRLVVHVESGTVNDPEVREQFGGLLERVRGVEQVVDVTGPYDDAGAAQVSRDGQTAFANVTFANINPELDNVRRIIDLAEETESDTVQVEVGGPSVQLAEQPGTGRNEAIGLAIAAVILFIAFGSLLAMFLPMITAIVAIATGITLIVLLTHVMDITDFAPQLAALLGLGVGIDYALFIVTRFRENMQAGMEPDDAVATAVNTSGRAVLFAGITVCIAVLGMFLLGVTFLYGLAVTTSLAVALTMFAALTLLPALLGLFGRHALSRREQRRLRREGPHSPELSGAWGNWSRWVQRHRWWALGTSTVILVVLALPIFGLQLGVADEGNGSKDSTTRQAYDLLAEGFGPGFNGQFQIAVDTSQATNPRETVAALQQRLGEVPNVVAVTPAVFGPNGETAIINLYPETSPQDEKTAELLDRLRDDVLPDELAGTGAVAHVGGLTAIFDDFSNVLAKKVPQFVGVVVLLSFLLLMWVFRSVVIPLKAALLNLLSIAGAFGVTIAIFQWGWGAELIGVDRTGPIEPFLPVMIFAVLFGLSMDYEVFLVSRIHEEWVRVRDNTQAVTNGLAATGRVITAAAAIMMVIFASFALSGERSIMLFGISFAVAVFLDAFLIRSLLVPAFMQIVGDANWWLPKWLDRVLPEVHLEAEDLHEIPHAEPVGNRSG